jgi:hypothetical protein
MAKVTMSMTAVGIFILLMQITMPVLAQTAKPADDSEVRIGTFDSRAVAIACYRSEPFKAELRKKFSGLDKAKEAGDEKRVKELEAEGPALQELMHLQGFGTWPIDDVLSRIKDQLPEIAKQADVQVIVSIWDITFQQQGVQFVDVTDLMVKPFEPDAETLKVIKEIREKAPIATDVLKKHKH